MDDNYLPIILPIIWIFGYFAVSLLIVALFPVFLRILKADWFFMDYVFIIPLALFWIIIIPILATLYIILVLTKLYIRYANWIHEQLTR